MLKKVVFPFLAGLALLLALSLSSALAAQDGQANGELLDRVVAIVNDDVITELELNDELALIKGQLRAQNTRIPPDDI
ncbi:MAG TPA: molecular chaperone SurA, partial [Gammaproteobacteria bacterium]|nr:molecular chaperone SurA [Gammaproteobacteria bacterium]